MNARTRPEACARVPCTCEAQVCSSGSWVGRRAKRRQHFVFSTCPPSKIPLFPPRISAGARALNARTRSDACARASCTCEARFCTSGSWVGRRAKRRHHFEFSTCSPTKIPLFPPRASAPITCFERSHSLGSLRTGSLHLRSAVLHQRKLGRAPGKETSPLRAC